MPPIAVLGASGFVGSAVVAAARQAGLATTAVKAPRLNSDSDQTTEIAALARLLKGCDIVVNCAGNPDASAVRLDDLHWANAVLPGVVGAAAQMAGARRYIHVSSAVVQGRRPVLDSTDLVEAFSPYSRSKIAGELSALKYGPACTSIYRPPSVHAPSRTVTRRLTAIARSPLSTIAAPGDRPTPQTHIDDVADAILFIATSKKSPPPIVHHPWQGHTTAGLLRALGGGRSPRIMPTTVARSLLLVCVGLSHVVPRLAANTRRLELIWFGQAQAPSWLTVEGWRPKTTQSDWVLLADAVTVTQRRI